MSQGVAHAPDFVPRLPWWGGDLQTVCNYLPSRLPALAAAASERLHLPTRDGSGDVMQAVVDLPARPAARPAVVLLHGLAGSESSCYMLLAAAYFLERGHTVVRLNLRGAGLSRPHCRLQYHALRIDDVQAAIMGLPEGIRGRGVLAVGFSLGGNLLLNHLAGYGTRAPVLAAATVSAPIDLLASARALLRWRNTFYHRYMLGHLKRNCTAPGAELIAAERRAILRARSVLALDHGFTAPRAGHDDALSYYEDASARRRLPLVRTPTLLIHAMDDPFVPAEAYLEVKAPAEGPLRLLLTRGGGHLGFHDALGIWHLRRIDAFFEARTAPASFPGAD